MSRHASQKVSYGGIETSGKHLWRQKEQPQRWLIHDVMNRMWYAAPIPKNLFNFSRGCIILSWLLMPSANIIRGSSLLTIGEILGFALN